MPKKYYVFILLCVVIVLTAALILFKNSGQKEWKLYECKIASVYTRDNPIHISGMEKFSNDVKEISKGQLIIEYYAAGEYKGIKPFDVFDAVSKGTVEMGFGASPYWAAEKIPGSEFMYAVPFGLSAKGMYAWLYRGGGLELWREIYEKFNVIPFPVGNTGGAMGGWFKKEITKIEDFRGMKIRMIGLQQKAMEKLGATAKWMLAIDALQYFDKGEIDAIVCLGPYTDQRYKLHRGPKYYYYPGWQEPGGVLSFIINKDAWEELPPHLRKTIEVVCGNTYQYISNQFDTMNSKVLPQLLEKEKVILKKFPPEVLNELRRLSKALLDEEARKSTQFNKIYQSFKKFKEKNIDYGWDKILAESVYTERMPKLINELDKLSVASARQEGNNTVVISLSGDTSFAFNSSTPTPALSNEIMRIAGIIKNYSLSIKLIRVEGHTDSQGSPYNNWVLSRGRANAVVNLLKKNGIKKSLIKPVFYGDAMPIADNRTDAGRLKNRRVEIVIEF
jgi:TRAP-type mannitol/chloroaromatic compound transport system substrate-binding protein